MAPTLSALEEIASNAPMTEPRDGPTVGFQRPADPEHDDSANETVEEAFREGVVRGWWEAAQLAIPAIDAPAAPTAQVLTIAAYERMARRDGFFAQHVSIDRDDFHVACRYRAGGFPTFEVDGVPTPIDQVGALLENARLDPLNAPAAHTLEQQIAALVRQHGLSALTMAAYARDGDVYFGSSAHSDGLCAHSELGLPSDTSIAAHLSSAIDALNAKRTVKADVPALAPMQVAA